MDCKQKFREKLLEIETLRKEILQPSFQELGLSAGQPRVLSRLMVKDNITQKELADICNIDPATLSRALDRLELTGYIKRSPHPSCRRSFLITLTGEGRQKAECVVEIFRSIENKMLEGFQPEEVDTIINALERIHRNLAAV